jgi:DMSO reductase anchor subunit
MHPAFSVIFFTTASGAGFGLFAWMGLLAMLGSLPSRTSTLATLVVAAVLAAGGLLSSLGHLGQPQRAWRAYSQWRSSWLSREGIFATACFVPAAWLGWMAFSTPEPSAADLLVHGWDVAPTTAVRLAGFALAALAIASVICTAMIYASLKPIPAWRHPLVLPVYLVFALYSGGFLYLAVVMPIETYVPRVGGACLLGAVLLCAMKLAAWRIVDSGLAQVSRNQALGLPHDRPVQVFERPHTEANYLLKEMGYVLARKHARKLRVLSVVLFAALPILFLMVSATLPHGTPQDVATILATLCVLTGALVERWLFFAEARHLVTLYY